VAIATLLPVDALRVRAEALLRNELLQEAFTTLEKRYTDEWRVTKVRDTDARERLWQAVNIVGKVRDHLATLVGNGKLAQRQLADLANPRPKRFGIL
jgi:osmotically-inducible protein OsmY